MAEILHHVINLVEDHFELAHLEYRYEREQSWRRLGKGALVGICVLSAFLFLQLAIVIGLLKAGFPLYAICLFFAGFYAGTGALIFRRFGIRDTRVGDPFQGSRDEFKRSLEWMHRLLS